jgi:quercetin dioxygenase-like cupin family protein
LAGSVIEQMKSDAFTNRRFTMNVFLVRHRTFFVLAVCAVIGVGVMTMAQHTGKGQVKSTQVSQRDIIEKLDGKDASATVRMVTIEPSQKDSAHRHAGPVFGYVLEGEYEHAMDEEPVKTYKAGETFYEPSGAVHRVARNPSAKIRTRLLAVIVHPRDAKEVTIREKGKE